MMKRRSFLAGLMASAAAPLIPLPVKALVPVEKIIPIGTLQYSFTYDGMVMMADSGWIPAAGQAIQRSIFPKLFAELASWGNAGQSRFWSEDPSASMPDLRAEYWKPGNPKPGENQSRVTEAWNKAVAPPEAPAPVAPAQISQVAPFRDKDADDAADKYRWYTPPRKYRRG